MVLIFPRLDTHLELRNDKIKKFVSYFAVFFVKYGVTSYVSYIITQI